MLTGTTRELEGGSVFLPRVEAERILTEATGLSSLELRFERQRILTEAEVAFVERVVAERVTGKPLQYILGHQHFRMLDLACREGVLIPRPETELVVDAVLVELTQCSIRKALHASHEHEQYDGAWAQDELAKRPIVVDIGCGTGAIALSIAAECPQADVYATDISDQALSLIRENAEIAGVKDRVTIIKSDLFGALDALKGRVNVIVSNPPYIPTDDLATLQREVLREPRLALDGGDDGLDFYRAIVGRAGEFLMSGGCIVFEIGFDQGPAVAALLATAGFSDVAVLKDFQVHDRIVIARGG
jgi:release factor glutamine methyltransferase